MAKEFRSQVSDRMADLARSTDDRFVGGVCGGLGAHLGVDPTVVRPAVVLMALANGVGFLLYAVAWAVLPEIGRAHV